MRRSRSGDGRVRLDLQAAGAARRALHMLDDSAAADLTIFTSVPAAEVVIVHRADPRPEQSGRQDFFGQHLAQRATCHLRFDGASRTLVD